MSRCARDPTAKGLPVDFGSLGDRADRCALREVLMLLIEYEPHRAFSYLWRIPAGLRHGSILLRSGASTKPWSIPHFPLVQRCSAKPKFAKV